MLKVLHNNICSKSRAILEYLDENNVPFEIIDIVQNPLSNLELITLLKKLGKSASELCRKGDAQFKEKFGTLKLDEDQYLKILQENPTLIERPILIKDGIAMIGRPIENVRFFIS